MQRPAKPFTPVRFRLQPPRIKVLKIMRENKNYVVVSGGFDPLHSGHIALFKNASEYGKVIAIVNNDNFLLRKKKYIFMPTLERLEVVSSNQFISEAIISIDQDNTVSSTIQKLIDDGYSIKYFANGGDRKTSFDIPESQVCKKNNIELIFGIGGGKTQSSSDLTETLFALMSQETEITKNISIQNITQKPWGSYQVLQKEDTFLVKKLIINPGEEISNQFHHHRHEHWILVSGSITVMLDGKKYDMHSNNHLYIPQGSQHQIINPFSEIAEIIEVQSGNIINEDDIVRLSDKYKRDDE
jgi:cytidyltransferase-like protein